MGRILKNGFLYRLCIAWIVLVCFFNAHAAKKAVLLGDRDEGSLGGFVHNIPLIDYEGKVITPDDETAFPFSMKGTCGSCHDYETIHKGWHFNAPDPNVKSGRKGQPWLFVDTGTATQIPLSYRAWPGVFKPNQIGLNPFDFTVMFGRQMPGGGPGEVDINDPEKIARQMVSGKLETNCLACHYTAADYDQAEFAAQVSKQNFRWAATAACGFASVSGSAAKMPDTYDYLLPGALQDVAAKQPKVIYNKNIFDEKYYVFFDIEKQIPSKKCYFCHSNKIVKDANSATWMSDEDVHLKAGMKCIDCHRNGLEHNITRNYECESKASSNPMAATLTCSECHLKSGRLGAPIATHKGISPQHFEKLTCTACHSGAWPENKAVNVKTSRAHGLGTFSARLSYDALPHIETPVFAKGDDGKIGVYNMVWPAFWAVIKTIPHNVVAQAGVQVVNECKIEPVNQEIVKAVVGKIISSKKTKGESWPELTKDDVKEILKSLSAEKDLGGQAAYICGGRVYQLDEKGELIGKEDAAAKPYLWPIAHNVRPAAQSLGAKTCNDCHATKSPFFFGKVTIDTPFADEKAAAKNMTDFEQLDNFYMKIFAMSLMFKPYLRVELIIVGLILIAALLRPSMIIQRPNGGGFWTLLGIFKKLAFVFAILSFVTLVVSGFWQLVFLRANLSGYLLILHTTAGGVFVGCIGFLAATAADENRFAAGGAVVKKACFWLIIILTLPLILSILLSMFTLFGTSWQRLLLNIHLYCALLFIVTGIAYIFAMIAGRRK